MTILPIKKTTLLFKLSILSISSALSQQAIASDAIGPGDSDSKWIMGGSVVAFNNPFIGEGTDDGISPNIRYNGEHFFIKDNSLNLHIAELFGFSGGLTAVLDGAFLSDYRDYDDNEKLAGLTERDATVLSGVYINHDTELGRLSFSALSDLGNEHHGHVANLKYTFDFKAGGWKINPTLGMQWASDKYVNHHVGVSVTEATFARAEYQGESTTNAFAGIRARYDITENWDVNLNTGVTKLGSGFTNSSIIEDDLVYQASVGINYNF